MWTHTYIAYMNCACTLIRAQKNDSTMKKKKTLPPAIPCMNLDNIRVSEIRQRKTNTIWYCIYVVSGEKSWFHRNKEKNDGFQRLRVGNRMMQVKEYKVSDIRKTNSEVLIMCSMMTAVSNTALSTGKLLSLSPWSYMHTVNHANCMRWRMC